MRPWSPHNLLRPNSCIKNSCIKKAFPIPASNRPRASPAPLLFYPFALNFFAKGGAV